MSDPVGKEEGRKLAAEAALEMRKKLEEVEVVPLPPVPDFKFNFPADMSVADGLRVMADTSHYPLDQRIQALNQLYDEGRHELVEGIIEGLYTKNAPSAEDAEKLKNLKQFIKKLKEGVIRTATFRKMHDSRADVVLGDGQTARVFVPDLHLRTALEPGDLVLIDKDGIAVLGREAPVVYSGEVVTVEEILPNGRARLHNEHAEDVVYTMSEALLKGVDDGAVTSGSRVLACSKQQFAFELLPQAENRSKYQYMAKESLPNTRLADLGAPPAYIQNVLDAVRMEMVAPEIRRKYNLQRPTMKLLSGPSGTGKSYSVYALWRELYELMSEVTGVPIDELPKRVMRLRMATALSQWLGQSDKNIDRFFNEAEELAAEPFEHEGQSHTLPCFCILEEFDGLARERGHEPIMDRIMTTALERLDSTRPELRDKLIVFIATTNVVGQIDPAFIRRIGGTVEQFPRLNTTTFGPVFNKHVTGRPTAVPAEELTREVHNWLFDCPNNSREPMIEVQYLGSDNWVAKHRSDMLTPAIIDKAVQEAAAQACKEEFDRGRSAGITPVAVITQLDRQIQAIARAVTAHNAHEFIETPGGTRVQDIRRV